MRALHYAITVSALICLAASWSRALSRSVEIHRPMDKIYAAMTNYFSPDSLHNFQLVSRTRNQSKAEFVAKRTMRDKIKWSQLAYCTVPALQMLDTLQRGNITVKVKLERESADHTFVTVTPDFEGTYELAGTARTQQCASNGVLEKDILRAAGAADTDLN
ncbi:MAG TPA: hypothetical protein VGH29_06900 [Candidatus Binataceae bacterium]